MDVVWDIFCDYLFLTKHLYGVQIISFVLMSNHFHLLLHAPNLNVSAFMNYFLREVSKELNRHGNRINECFANRHYRTYVGDNYLYILNTYKYIYQNPLRAGLCSAVQDYPFSTLYGKLGNGPLYVPVESDDIIFNGSLEENLLWLNTLPEKSDYESMRTALKKGIFKLRKCPRTKTANKLESSLL